MKAKSSKEDPIYFDHYDPADLIKIIATQHEATYYLKKQKYKMICQALIIVDDFAGEASLSCHSNYYNHYTLEVGVIAHRRLRHRTTSHTYRHGSLK